MSPEELETTCGLGQWRPKFLQALASKKVYIFIYGAIGIIKVHEIDIVVSVQGWPVGRKNISGGAP